MLIRQETGSDFDAVYTIVQEAFAAAELALIFKKHVIEFAGAEQNQ